LKVGDREEEYIQEARCGRLERIHPKHAHYGAPATIKKCPTAFEFGSGSVIEENKEKRKRVMNESWAGHVGVGRFSYTSLERSR